MIRAVLAVLAVLLSSLPAAAVGAPIGFGLVATENSTDLAAVFQPLIDDLSAGTGQPFEIKTYGDYAGVIWAMRSGSIMAAHVGNKSAMEAVDNASAEVGVRYETVTSEGYHALIITNISGPYRSLDDVFAHAGEITFGTGDPNSTSGTVVPGYFLFAARGVTPQAVFKRVVPGNHEKNYLAVATGKVDVATNNDMDMGRYLSRYPGLAGKIRIIWKSPPIPGDPFIWRQDLPTHIKQEIQAFLVQYGRQTPGKSSGRLAHEKQVLEGLHIRGFLSSDNSQLGLVRILELSRHREQVLTDASLTAAARQAKLKDIDARMEALKTRHPLAEAQ